MSLDSAASHGASFGSEHGHSSLAPAHKAWHGISISSDLCPFCSALFGWTLPQKPSSVHVLILCLHGFSYLVLSLGGFLLFLPTSATHFWLLYSLSLTFLQVDLTGNLIICFSVPLTYVSFFSSPMNARLKQQCNYRMACRRYTRNQISSREKKSCCWLEKES